jgi:hypothetical protein
LSASWSRSRNDVEQALLRSLLPLALVLPAFVLVAWAVVRVGLAPLRRLGTLLAARPAAALGPGWPRARRRARWRPC